MAITKLEDFQNFGEWKTTINNVIDSVNGYDGINAAVNESIEDAHASGQLGEYLSVSSLKDFDRYTFNGCYHMDASCTNGPERGVIFKLYCLALSNGYITQIAISNTKIPTELYIRSKTVTGSGWTTWSKVVRREEADETYFPFVGGTIEGSVSIIDELTVDGKSTLKDNLVLKGSFSIEEELNSLVIRNNGSQILFKIAHEGEEGSETPIEIDEVTQTANINGTAKYASNLHRTALSDRTDDKSNTVAASALAVSTLADYLEVNYVKVTGGEFRGIVQFANHIGLSEDSIIRIPSDLNLRVAHGVNIVSTESFANLYLERDNEPIQGTEYPFTFGTRTRTGITDYGVGSPVYEMGGLEVAEEYTKWRLRKQNISTGENDKANVYLMMKKDEITPSEDGTIALGSTAQKFSQVFASTDTIATSDKNCKTNIQKIDPELIKKWGEVEWKSFMFKDAVEKKGMDARTHTGVIAQDIQEIIPDAEKYGFFCYDEWDEIKDKEYIQVPVILEKEDGTTEPSYVIECKETIKRPAGSQFSIRYQELQAIENQYLRSRIATLEAELNRVKQLLDID